jgi:hypothetical protein
VSAVVRHGFAIESLVELPDGPELRRFAGQAGLVRGFPARFLLIARRQTI